MILQQVNRYQKTVLRELEITPSYRIPVTLGAQMFHSIIDVEAYRRHHLRLRFRRQRIRFHRVGGSLCQISR